MNTFRINALAAKAMGWAATAIIEDTAFGCPAGELSADDDAWCPIPNYCHSISDALELLEHVADGMKWSIRHVPDYGFAPYGATIEGLCGYSGKSLCEAIIKCALNASPLITDDELNEALEQP
jgi:hypothetical protein